MIKTATDLQSMVQDKIGKLEDKENLSEKDEANLEALQDLDSALDNFLATYE